MALALSSAVFDGCSLNLGFRWALADAFAGSRVLPKILPGERQQGQLCGCRITFCFLGVTFGADGEVMDGDAQFAEAADMVANQLFLLGSGQFGGSGTVLKRLLAGQRVVGQAEERMGDRDDSGSFFASLFGADSPELVFEEAVLLGGGRPGALGQSAAQPRVAARGAGAHLAAGTFVVARTDTGPGSQVTRRGEAGHVRAGFGQNGRSADLEHTRQRWEQIPVFLQAGLADLLFDIGIQFLQLGRNCMWSKL